MRCAVVEALLWAAPEIMKATSSQETSEETRLAAVSTQKAADVYSFAIIMHQVIYRTPVFQSADHCQPIAAKSTSTRRRLQ